MSTSITGRSKRYQFLRTDGETLFTRDGGILIPVADGTYFTAKMDMDRSIGNVFVQFFSGTADNPVAVTPSAGTVTVEAGAYRDQWLMPSQTDSHVIQANTILAEADGAATYTPPSFDSRALYSRIVLSGVSGATFMIADHWRSIA